MDEFPKFAAKYIADDVIYFSKRDNVPVLKMLAEVIRLVCEKEEAREDQPEDT